MSVYEKYVSVWDKLIETAKTSRTHMADMTIKDIREMYTSFQAYVTMKHNGDHGELLNYWTERALWIAVFGYEATPPQGVIVGLSIPFPGLKPKPIAVINSQAGVGVVAPIGNPTDSNNSQATVRTPAPNRDTSKVSENLSINVNNSRLLDSGSSISRIQEEFFRLARAPKAKLGARYYPPGMNARTGLPHRTMQSDHDEPFPVWNGESGVYYIAINNKVGPAVQIRFVHRSNRSLWLWVDIVDPSPAATQMAGLMNLFLQDWVEQSDGGQGPMIPILLHEWVDLHKHLFTPEIRRVAPNILTTQMPQIKRFNFDPTRLTTYWTSAEFKKVVNSRLRKPLEGIQAAGTQPDLMTDAPSGQRPGVLLPRASNLPVGRSVVTPAPINNSQTSQSIVAPGATSQISSSTPQQMITHQQQPAGSASGPHLWHGRFGWDPSLDTPWADWRNDEWSFYPRIRFGNWENRVPL